MKPDISIYGSAYRPELWMRFYDSIGKNDISFEIIFAGPNEPTFTLPDNFKFIKTDVKPAQCVEIAARQTRADLIMDVADDTVFLQEHPLDMLYETYISYNNPKLMLSCRFAMNGNNLSRTWHKFVYKDMSSPTVPVSGLVSRQLYIDMGGIDKNFVAVMFPLDIAMRIYALGGDIVLSDVFINEIRGSKGVCQEFWNCDRPLLDRLWPNVNKDGPFNRTAPVEPFLDKNILIESQGPKGRWV